LLEILGGDRLADSDPNRGRLKMRLLPTYTNGLQSKGCKEKGENSVVHSGGGEELDERKYFLFMYSWQKFKGERREAGFWELGEGRGILPFCKRGKHQRLKIKENP